MGFRVYKRTELDEQGNPYPLLYMSRTEKSLETMKTIRLLYPDHVSGGLETYYFGAHLLTHILPQNERQPLVKVDIAPPDHKEKEVEEGIYAREKVLAGIEDAAKKIEGEKPDRIITIGGNCMVSLAPFDYLHGKYKDTGIIWIDAHRMFPQQRTDTPTPMQWCCGHFWDMDRKFFRKECGMEVLNRLRFYILGCSPSMIIRSGF